MKQVKIALLLLGATLLLFGCGKKEEKNATTSTPAPTEATSMEPEDTEQPEATPESLDGKVKSRLTGEWVSKEAGTRRPYAIMLNNIQAANPQSGIGQASILYECLVEGGITRLMGVFEEFDAKRIGSVRSARHYYCSIADEYDAIFVHFGQTKYAIAKMEELGINNLSGLEAVGSTVFYRDSNIKAPHNAFASYDGIIKGTKSKKYRTEYRENCNSHYEFYESDTDLTSDKIANKVTLGFSNARKPYLVYNQETKLYDRFQYGGKHIDATTKEQLAYKNVIVQFVKEWDIDKNHYQTMAIENNEGNGLYITNGKAIPITWKKNEAKKTMSYYDKDGNKLYVNTGKTYIALFPNNRTDDVVISK